MNLIWNGGKSESFKPSKGIRQGDPWSPYIFILCMERLSHLINLTVENKLWKPFKIARNGLAISHLCFTDYLILFVKANKEQAQFIKS